ILIAFPLLYLGLEVILSFVEINSKKSWSDRQKIRYNLNVIAIYFGILSVLIVITPNQPRFTAFLPVIVLGTALSPAIMFLFM
ncbi:MAG: hypothetical protein ACFFAN_09965, partial [Promethearchaeota archaeon]